VPYPLPSQPTAIDYAGVSPSQGADGSPLGTITAAAAPNGADATVPVTATEAEHVATAPDFQGLAAKAELALVTDPGVSLPTVAEGGPSSSSSFDGQLEWLVTYTFSTPVPVQKHGGTPTFVGGEGSASASNCLAKSETIIVDPVTGKGLLAFLTDGTSN